MTLAEFLLARITAEEFMSTEASRGDDFERHAARGELPTYSSFCQVKHIRTWSPARVLAECEAKRRIVEKHRTMVEMAAERPDDPFPRHAATVYESVLRDLAIVYASHPDYREEWRP